MQLSKIFTEKVIETLRVSYVKYVSGGCLLLLLDWIFIHCQASKSTFENNYRKHEAQALLHLLLFFNWELRGMGTGT